MEQRTYSTRGAAVRAARNACRKALGPYFEAYEGPDYEIHPESRGVGYLAGYRYYYRLRGPAKDASEGRE